MAASLRETIASVCSVEKAQVGDNPIVSIESCEKYVIVKISDAIGPVRYEKDAVAWNGGDYFGPLSGIANAEDASA